MDAKDYIVNEVLRDARRFMVPIYQRQYQWGKKRLDPLWEDIVGKADEFLQGNSKFMHYNRVHLRPRPPQASFTE